MPKVPPKQTQIDKFRETARAVETDDNEVVFDRALATVASHTADRDDRAAERKAEAEARGKPYAGKAVKPKKGKKR